MASRSRPLAVYDGWKRRREAFFSRLEEMAVTADRSPEEADAFAADAVRAVRQVTAVG